ncbi:MAG: hypoxanthine phosphoribosyltransferase [Phycisphaerae bacterium]|nr:hypoxanthine phosphoribosyltransferase [Phycisphaerae bacterium]
MRIQRVLIRREQIAQRVADLGREITAALEHERLDLERAGQTPGPLVLVPVLTGALVFVADLIRHMPVSMSIRPVTLSSYPGKATSSQGVTVQSGLPTDLKGARVLVVDDILDSGRTLGLLRRVIAAQHPQSLRLAVLLNKTKAGGRDEEVAVEHFGFRIDDEFVVGYGLDFDGLYRNTPDIVTLTDGREGV